LSEFDEGMGKLEAIKEEVAEKRKLLMSDIRETAPELEDFLRMFREDKELNSKVVWIELDGEVRFKWGRVL
jgi:hypothetical protein